jgi:hypothetical protein
VVADPNSEEAVTAQRIDVHHHYVTAELVKERSPRNADGLRARGAEPVVADGFADPRRVEREGEA